MSTTLKSSDDEDYGDLIQVIARLWARRLWIALSAFLFTALFAAVAFLTTPVYRASTLLVPSGAERSGLGGAIGSALGSLGGLASLAGIGVGAEGSETEEALAVLRSRQLTESFIRDRQLMPILFAEKWDSQANNWKSGTKPPTPAEAYKYFDRGIRSILYDKKTGLITVNVDWRNREQAAEWANELVQRLNTEMRARAINSANASVGYLEAELKKTQVIGTQEAINHLIEAQIKQRMLANVTQDYALRVVDRAMAPDANDRLKPHKLVLIMAGAIAGVVIGIGVVLLAGWLASARTLIKR